MSQATITQAKELARLSSDCSFLLTHLIRKNDQQDEMQTLSPRDKLVSILSINDENKPTLNAHEVDWYGSTSTENAKIFKPYTNNQFIQPSLLKGVCFTESTLAGLKAHRDIFDARYGLAFDRDFLFKKWANPCLNIRDRLLKDTAINYNPNSPQSPFKNVHNFIPDQLIGFVNIIHESFDSTHEREWRILGDFPFNYSEIKFIFCPEDDFEIFSKIQTHGLPPLFVSVLFLVGCQSLAISGRS